MIWEPLYTESGLLFDELLTEAGNPLYTESGESLHVPYGYDPNLSEEILMENGENLLWPFSFYYTFQDTPRTYIFQKCLIFESETDNEYTFRQELWPGEENPGDTLGPNAALIAITSGEPEEFISHLTSDFRKITAGNRFLDLDNTVWEAPEDLYLIATDLKYYTPLEIFTGKGILGYRKLIYRPQADRPTYQQTIETAFDQAIQQPMDQLDNHSRSLETISYLLLLFNGINMINSVIYTYKDESTVTIQIGNCQAEDEEKTYRITSTFDLAGELDANQRYFVYLYEDGNGDTQALFHTATDPGLLHQARLPEWIETDDSGDIIPFSQALTIAQIPPGLILEYIGADPPLGWRWSLGQPISPQSWYTALYTIIGDDYHPEIIVTINTTTDILTSADHQLETGMICQMETTGTLPDPINAEEYYYIEKIDVDTVKLRYLDEWNNPQGYVDFTTAGTGTHTIHTSQVLWLPDRDPGTIIKL